MKVMNVGSGFMESGASSGPKPAARRFKSESEKQHIKVTQMSKTVQSGAQMSTTAASAAQSEKGTTAEACGIPGSQGPSSAKFRTQSRNRATEDQKNDRRRLKELLKETANAKNLGLPLDKANRVPVLCANLRAVPTQADKIELLEILADGLSSARMFRYRLTRQFDTMYQANTFGPAHSQDEGSTDSAMALIDPPVQSSAHYSVPPVKTAAIPAVTQATALPASARKAPATASGSPTAASNRKAGAASLLRNKLWKPGTDAVGLAYQQRDISEAISRCYHAYTATLAWPEVANQLTKVGNILLGKQNRLKKSLRALRETAA